ncbi:MAG: hypothetical protein PHP82_02515, partial [Candidatus ainarchaeum sp.]|nr:hypothetical protein [Candidatus ainarchaeum sp.]
MNNNSSEKGFFDFVINEPDSYWKIIILTIKKTHLLAFKYPKLILFSICIILAYFAFQNEF